MSVQRCTFQWDVFLPCPVRAAVFLRILSCPSRRSELGHLSVTHADSGNLPIVRKWSHVQKYKTYCFVSFVFQVWNVLNGILQRHSDPTKKSRTAGDRSPWASQVRAFTFNRATIYLYSFIHYLWPVRRLSYLEIAANRPVALTAERQSQ